MNLSKNSIYTLEQRYLRKDEKGKVIETPEQMMIRTASICKDLNLRQRILQYLLNIDFLPNSPTLMNAGTDMGQLSACFVLPVGDSLVEIFDAVKYTAIIHQSGGGTGYNFSNLRPEGWPVKSTQGVASGAVSFMECFNTATGTVKQGGKRRGAMMAILNIDHPEIEKFICCKNKGNALENFNISVAVTDKFMNAVVENKDWNLIWQGKTIKTVKAKYLFDLIVDNAYSHGDPGLIFIDEINRNVKPGQEMVATNPCGEQPLLPYESCNLASMNLNNMLINKDGKYYLDYPKISALLTDMIAFMNVIIDENKYPLPQIKEATLKSRKIGIGIMGWADILIKMEMSYGSPESLKMAKDLMKFINDKCHEIAGETNGNLTTIAPTGSISVIANVSSGIEPIYAVAYKRDLKDSMGRDYFEINDEFIRIAKEQGFYSEELISKILRNHGSVKGIDIVPQNIQQLFITAHDIPFTEHIKMQAEFQKHTDSACSKTINMSNGINKNDISLAYMLSWELKCKGITVYRDGSKDRQVLITEENVLKETPRPRKKDQIAIVRKIPTGCGVLYNIISFDQFGILENFVVNAGNGGCESSQSAEGRFLSSMLRFNIPMDVIIEQARKAKPCSSCLQKSLNNAGDKIRIKSCSDGIGKHIQDYEQNKEIRATIISVQKILDATINKGAKINDSLVIDSNPNKEKYHCTNCGSTNVDPGKCRTCRECGLSLCL